MKKHVSVIDVYKLLGINLNPNAVGNQSEQGTKPKEYRRGCSDKYFLLPVTCIFIGYRQRPGTRNQVARMER